MASAPNPAHLRDYQARLNDLQALRATHVSSGNDDKVTNLNRQIQAQLKWIAAAEKLAAPAA